MKLLVILVVVAVASAVPAPQQFQNPQEVQLLRFDSDSDGLGTYSYSFEQSDKTQREEQGELKNAGTDDEAIVVRGSYSWVGPDGGTYKVTYIADENGFQPKIEQTGGVGVPSGVVASLLG